MEILAVALSWNLNLQELKILQVLPKVQKSKDSHHIGTEENSVHTCGGGAKSCCGRNLYDFSVRIDSKEKNETPVKFSWDDIAYHSCSAHNLGSSAGPIR